MICYRRPSIAPFALSLLTGAMLAAGSLLANAATMDANGATISAQLKADNPQALQFEDNGSVVRTSMNSQVNSSGRLVMGQSLPSWMGNSGVFLDRARSAGLYVPGEVSYLQDARPQVVLAIQSYGAAVFQSTHGAINNPTLLLPVGKAVTFTVMDFSNGYPGTFTLVRKAPPYPTFINLSDEDPVFDSGWINRTPLSGAYSPYRTITYTFAKPGTYYYLSMQPGNANGGEWGKIIVKSPAAAGGAA